MSLVERAQAIRERLRNPPNAVPDTGINLKKKITRVSGVIVEAGFSTFTQAQAKPVEDYGIGSAVPRYVLEYNFSGVFAFTTLVKNIQKVVCNTYGVRLEAMLSARRDAKIVRPRMIAVYLAKKLTNKSLPELGARFGGRDHTTILHSVRKITAERLVNADLDRELTELELLLKRPHNTAEDAPCNSVPAAAQ
jgi:hypothetical protein